MLDWLWVDGRVVGWVRFFNPCVEWNNKSQIHSIYAICILKPYRHQVCILYAQANEQKSSESILCVVSKWQAPQERKSDVEMIWCWHPRKWMTVGKHNENANLKAIKQPRRLQALAPFLMIISKKKHPFEGRRLCWKKTFYLELKLLENVRKEIEEHAQAHTHTHTSPNSYWK